MLTSASRRRRARPVADAPALDGSELARAWLVELVAAAPLEHAVRLPAARFAEEAPRLCGAVVAALASDAALRDLEPGGPLAPIVADLAGVVAAPGGALDVVATLEALRSVTWGAVLDALEGPQPAQVAELADRLGTIAATLAAAAIGAAPPIGRTPPLGVAGCESVAAMEAGDAARPPGTAETDPARAAGEARHRVDDARLREASDPPNRSASDRVAPDGDETLARIEATLREAAHAADPLREAAERLRDLARGVDVGIGAATGQPPRARPDVRPQERASGGDRRPDPARGAADVAAVDLDPPLDGLRVRRVAGDAGAASERTAPWTAAIQRRIERHRDDGRPFGVLCLEIADVERLLAAGDDGIRAALAAAEAAVLDRLRPADVLIPMRAGRYWLIAPDSDATDAVSLAHRITEAVAGATAAHDAPLRATVGVSACPADAQGAARLEELAEEALRAALAAGVRVCGARG